MKKCIFKGKKDLDQSVSFFLLTYYVILIMDQKLQELTNKLFEEGVVKGNQEDILVYDKDGKFIKKEAAKSGEVKKEAKKEVKKETKKK